MAGSYSSSGGLCNFDVYVSFRGADTRKIFVGHLYSAIKRRAISTFLDSEDLRKGNKISKLLNAIEDSRLSIVVLSENYASSSWCLKELVKILECMDTNNQIVVPIFYQVDPSHIRNLNGKFGEAFANKFGGADKQDLESWRSALTRVADLSGWDSSKYESDGHLIEVIVEDVCRKLICFRSSTSNHLVGMGFHITSLRSLLCLEVDDVRFLGIWGMGGIGKTTIARAVYEDIAYHFDYRYFLDNVNEGFIRKGEFQMQEEFLSRLLNLKLQSVHNLSKDRNMVMEGLGEKKVLLVLDCVENRNQITALLGKQHLFGGGSRIIITTRDKNVLSGVVTAIYEPQLLRYSEAVDLFTQYAFGTNRLSGDYIQLSRRAIEYAQGLPLALKVCGAFLHDKSVQVWEDKLNKVKIFPHLGVFKTSFEELDCLQKNIFLDIACFFKGFEKRYVTELLASCGFLPHYGLRVLVDRALITISDKVEMHNLLQEMGRHIVIQESIHEPGNRSRLWSFEDVVHVLNRNTATEVVESIIIDLSNSKEIYLHTEGFVTMTKLRLLKIFYNQPINSDDGDWRDGICHESGDCIQHLSGDLKFLSSQLRCLIWHGCPLKSLPSNFQPQNLVDLDMHCSHIEQLWEGTKPLKKLKFMNLSHSQYLTRTPDFTEATNLENLILEGCSSLLEIHPSISVLDSLVFLSLKDCKELKSLPSIIHLESLKSLTLSGCSNLEKFPEIPGVMKELSELYLDGTAITELPVSIEKLEGLEVLSMKNCRSLVYLPDNICNLAYLKELYLSGCSNLHILPENCKKLVRVAYLDLRGTGIVKQPVSITHVAFQDFSKESEHDFPQPQHMNFSNFELEQTKQREEDTSRNTGGEHHKMLKGVKEIACVGLEKNAEHAVQVVDEEYQALPEHLKSLFLYCSLFPSGYEFTQVDLVQLWIAEDFIREKKMETLEDIAIVYFNSLVSLGFFVFSRHDRSVDFGCLLNERDLVSLVPDYNGKNSLYKVNATKLSILENVSGNYCFTVVDGKLDGASEMTQHLSFASKRVDEMSFGALERFKHLRTLLLLSGCGSSIKQVPRSLFLRLKFLRTLNLSKTSISELPSSIGNVKSLCYLDVSHTPITQFPESLDSLCNLQTLKLRGCTHFVKLPKGMQKLISLRHIDLNIIQQLNSMPAHLGKLSNLRTLSAFLVGKDDGCRIEELKNLNHLKGELCISRLENVLSRHEAEEVDLIKKCLHKLELRWSNMRVEKIGDEDEVLDCLRPHSGLMELRILFYGGSKLPTWMNNPSFADLVSITLYRCTNCKLLPSLGELPALRFLYIKEMNEVQEISNQFFRNGSLEGCHAFRKLERLAVDVMLNLQLWIGVQTGDLPSLLKLTVHSCPKLVTLPSIACFKSLKHLEISSCPKIEFLASDGLPTSLESLIIVDCPKLKERCSKGKGEDWDKIPHASRVWFDHQEVNQEISRLGWF